MHTDLYVVDGDMRPHTRTLHLQVEVSGSARQSVGGSAVPQGYVLLDDSSLASLGCEVPIAEPEAPYGPNSTMEEASGGGVVPWLVFKDATTPRLLTTYA